LRTRAIPERFCGDDSLSAISSIWTFTFYLYLYRWETAQHVCAICSDLFQV